MQKAFGFFEDEICGQTNGHGLYFTLRPRSAETTHKKDLLLIEPRRYV
jgi:hypothetical protein